jgi:hypothetical protein
MTYIISKILACNYAKQKKGGGANLCKWYANGSKIA